MTWAYDPNDLLRIPVEILDWLKKGPNSKPHCVLCSQPMTMRNLHNERTAHFVHLAGSNCPSIKAAGEPYRYLQALPRRPGASHSTRDFVRSNLHGVFARMRFIASGLVWTEFEVACHRAKQLQVWDLIDLSAAYAPYVLLTCMETFPISQYRKREVRFFLEPNPQAGSYWMFPPGRKRILWEIDVLSGKQTQHPVNLNLATGDVIGRIEMLLS